MKKWVRVFPDPPGEDDIEIYLSDNFILAGLILMYPIIFLLGGMIL